MTVDKSCQAKLVSEVQDFKTAMNADWSEDEQFYITRDIIVHESDLADIPSGIIPNFVNNASVIVKGKSSEVVISSEKTWLDLISNQLNVFTDERNKEQAIVNSECPTSAGSTKKMNFKLGNNFPNPFNPVTKIPFSLKDNTDVNLTVYNSVGQEVAVLINEFLSAGPHLVEFNAAQLPSGPYFYKITTNDFSVVKRMALVK